MPATGHRLLVQLPLGLGYTAILFQVACLPVISYYIGEFGGYYTYGSKFRYLLISQMTDCLVTFTHGRPALIHSDEHDVPELTYSDFRDDQGGSKPVHWEYLERMLSLCAIISESRRVFSPKAEAADIKFGIEQIDGQLAVWSHERLRSRPSRTNTFDYWSACLDYTYNNVILVLHRINNDPVNESICAQSSSAIISTFASIQQHDAIRCCWFPAVHALFSAMIFLTTHLHSGNPTIAAATLHNLDISLLVLKDLSHSWLTAASILALFENSSNSLFERVRRALSGALSSLPGRDDLEMPRKIMDFTDADISWSEVVREAENIVWPESDDWLQTYADLGVT